MNAPMWGDCLSFTSVLVRLQAERSLGLQEWLGWGSLATKVGCVAGGSPGVEQRMCEDSTTTLC